ncbi:hypothetical protein K6119_11750 [Paracrocinitomix mangrovi]|uniref:hypothetical protein n=1 Tax=Paracrocinitomix mangrovi TaxID=2862509 RepID=UPI001C8E77C7|nr:hypothetical protein [Paracrocinitomix mangrovi]UKN00408.1 hypothetical protein K6119_11750 [Paracrocinitomix mangrovi]
MLKSVISFIVYSNLWISLGASSFCILYYQLRSIDIDWILTLFVFSSTLITYNFQRYLKLVYNENIQGARMIWMQNNKNLAASLMVVGGIGSVVFCINISWISLLLLIFSGLISFLYAFKFKLGKFSSNLRDIPGIKIYLISVVWAISCCIIPAVESQTLDFNGWLICTGYFLFILGITIPFDIRDIDHDDNEKHTIPQMIGVFWSKIVAIIAVLLSLILMEYPDFDSTGLLVSIIMTTVIIALSKKKRNELFYSFFMDGTLLLLPIGMVLLP